MATSINSTSQALTALRSLGRAQAAMSTSALWSQRGHAGDSTVTAALNLASASGRTTDTDLAREVAGLTRHQVPEQVIDLVTT